MSVRTANRPRVNTHKQKIKVSQRVHETYLSKLKHTHKSFSELLMLLLIEENRYISCVFYCLQHTQFVLNAAREKRDMEQRHAAVKKKVTRSLSGFTHPSMFTGVYSNSWFSINNTLYIYSVRL